MTGSCGLDDCTPSESGCNQGHGELSDCPNFKPKGDGGDALASPAPSVSAPTFPWSSAALGTSDLSYLAMRQRPRVIGVLGAADAGKTTFIVSCYLHLLRGEAIAHRRFSGSLTLNGWETLATWSRWSSKREAGFPLHTTSQDARQPGLLHLSLRAEGGLRDEVVLTDAPGEWFERWSENESDPLATGARWTARHSDALVLVADSDRLSGSSRGPAASGLQSLITRVSNIVHGRPVWLLWSKADKVVPASIRRRIERDLKRWLPEARQTLTRIDQPETLLEAADLIFGDALSPTSPLDLQCPSSAPSNPFLSYRGQ